MLIGEWYYVLRMLEREVPPIDRLIAREENPPTFAELEPLWAAQAAETRAAAESIRDWGREITYAVTDETGKTRRVTATPTDIFTQLVLHEVHHRAQVLNMLRHLGVKTEDIDYNVLMYTISEGG